MTVLAGTGWYIIKEMKTTYIRSLLVDCPILEIAEEITTLLDPVGVRCGFLRERILCSWLDLNLLRSLLGIGLLRRLALRDV